MGMFDNVLAVNITDPKFKHNNVWYQTKSIDCELSEYIIFNNQLWHQYDGSGDGERFDEAKAVDHTGEINIYTQHTVADKHFWIEYNLSFSGGHLSRVDLVEERLTKDYSDLSLSKPSPKSKSSCITIDFRGVDNQIYSSFHEELSKNLDELRSIVGDPKAEIVYQVKSGAGNGFALGPSTRWIHSVVQDLSDFSKTGEKTYTQNDSNGDSLTIILDEFSQY